MGSHQLSHQLSHQPNHQLNPQPNRQPLQDRLQRQSRSDPCSLTRSTSTTRPTGNCPVDSTQAATTSTVSSFWRTEPRPALELAIPLVKSPRLPATLPERNSSVSSKVLGTLWPTVVRVTSW